VGLLVAGAAAAAAVAGYGCASPGRALPRSAEEALQREGSYLVGEVEGLRREAVLQHAGPVFAAGGSARGEVIALSHGGGGTLNLSAFGLGNEARRLWTEVVSPIGREVEAVEVSADGARVVTCGRDGFARSYLVKERTAGPAFAAREPLVSAGLSWDGTRLAIGTAGGRVLVTSFPEMRLLASAELHGSQEVRGVAFREDGAIVSGGWDRSVAVSRVVGDVLQEESRRRLPEHVNDVSVSGRFVAVALSREPARGRRGAPEPREERNAAAVLDAQSLEELWRPVRHEGAVSTAAVTPDGAALFTGGWDGRLLVERRDQAPLEQRFGGAVQKVRLTRDARWLLVAAWPPADASGADQEPPSAVLYEVVRRAPEVVTPPRRPRPSQPGL
jgi:hypothetical protein